MPYLWLREGRTVWLFVPAALSLALFAWLLTLHPATSGRIYAAYDGVYVAMAVLRRWVVDGVRPDRWDLLGVAVTLLGMAIIAFAPRARGADASGPVPQQPRPLQGIRHSLSVVRSDEQCCHAAKNPVLLPAIHDQVMMGAALAADESSPCEGGRDECN